MCAWCPWPPRRSPRGPPSGRAPSRRLSARCLLDDLLARVLRLDRLRSSSVYVSWYCPGPSRRSASRSSGSPSAASSRRASPAGGMPSISARGTTSSAKRIVDIASAPSSGRIAVRYCLLRITTVPMATRSRSSIAARSSWYGLLRRVAVGHQPVGALVVDRVDVVEGDEVGDLDGPRGLRPQLVELVLVERDVAALADLEAHLDVVGVDLLAGLLGHLAVADPRARLLLELVEVDVVVADRGVAPSRAR